MANNLFNSSSQRGQGTGTSSSRNTSAVRSQVPNRFSLIPRPLPRLSEWSDPSAADSVWVSQDIMFGAGMIVIRPDLEHPLLSKFLVLYDSKNKYHFLPKGRKDIGESVETAALREAFEESGYPVEFMSVYLPHHQPPPNGDKDMRYGPCREALCVDIHYWPPTTRRGKRTGSGGEYLVTWFLGQVDPNAEYNPNTRMADEQAYESRFMSYDQAMGVVCPKYQIIIRYAWEVYHHTLEIEKHFEKLAADERAKEANNAQVT